MRRLDCLALEPLRTALLSRQCQYALCCVQLTHIARVIPINFAESLAVRVVLVAQLQVIDFR